MMQALLLIPTMALLNRVRGGGFGAATLPGHPRYWVTPFVALVCTAAMPVVPACIAALCWLAWSLPSWGYLMTLGHYAPDRDMSWVERTLLRVSGGHVWLAFIIRLAVGLIPAAVFVTPWAVLAAVPMWLGYEAGWKWTPAAPIRTGELVAGAVWGVLFIV